MKFVIYLFVGIFVAKIESFSYQRFNNDLDSENSENVIKINRIIGGRPINVSKLPWQVSLQRRVAFGFFHICGGSIIDSKWILTAAHCVEG